MHGKHCKIRPWRQVIAWNKSTVQNPTVYCRRTKRMFMGNLSIIRLQQVLLYPNQKRKNLLDYWDLDSLYATGDKHGFNPPPPPPLRTRFKQAKPSSLPRCIS